MKFAIVRLFHEGQRIAREQARAAAPIVGDLTIGDLVAENSSGRPLRRATLTESYGTNRIRRDLISPLFDVAILRMTDSGFVLRGFEISSPRAGETREARQEWWARPA